MIRLARRRWLWFLLFGIAGVALRLFFIHKFAQANGDALIYEDIALNWMRHGVYGLSELGEVRPTLIRLPGYTMFLVACFRLFGAEHYHAVMYVQTAFDLGTAWVLGATALRMRSGEQGQGQPRMNTDEHGSRAEQAPRPVGGEQGRELAEISAGEGVRVTAGEGALGAGERAALAVFAVYCLFPYTAVYVASALTETLTLFFLSLAIYFFIVGLQEGRSVRWVKCGAACAAAVILRPDGGLVLIAFGIYLLWRKATATTEDTKVARGARRIAGGEQGRERPQIYTDEHGARAGGEPGRERPQIYRDEHGARAEEPRRTQRETGEGQRHLPFTAHLFSQRAREQMGHPAGEEQGQLRLSTRHSTAHLFSQRAREQMGHPAGAADSFWRRVVRPGVIIGVVALLPLLPWAVRNYRTFHLIQPLAPANATDPGEAYDPGFVRWAHTWMLDFVSVYEIGWNVPGEAFDADLLPSRAFDSEEQRQQTLELVREYNADPALTPELDAKFGELAAARVRAHPWRNRIVLPVLRVADMWLRPRTEPFPIEARWWEFDAHEGETVFAVAYALLGMVFLALAGVGLWRGRVAFAGVLVAYVVLRSLFLLTVGTAEPRYTIECWPMVLLLAGVALAGRARATTDFADERGSSTQATTESTKVTRRTRREAG